jgi:ABC-2 type transport system ATP-binding protein
VTAESAYDVRGVEKTYRRTGVRANDGVDLTVAPGEVFGLLGPNGAGKSTLVRQLIGLQRPDRGSIALFGHDLVADPSVAARLVAYLGQDEPALLELPVHLAVSTTARMRGLPRRVAVGAADDVVEELGLGSVARTPMTRLSGGQRRLACFAAALAADRRVLLLDEPTTGLDPVARRSVWSAIRRRRDQHGTTVVLVTHNVAEAEAVLDRVAVLDRGRVIACDSPGRLKAQVSDDVRLELVWRDVAPMSDPLVASLATGASINGRRWSLRLPAADARDALGRLMTGATLSALDDFTLATATLEDVYLALGGEHDDLERS